MSEKTKAIQAIRAFWFSPDQFTDVIIKELTDNYQRPTHGDFGFTYESWHDKTFMIDYKFGQITCINRGYESTSF